MVETTATLPELLHAIDLWEKDRDRTQAILERDDASGSGLDTQARELLLQELVVAHSQIEYLREHEEALLKRTR
jgi:hypothetical protein